MSTLHRRAAEGRDKYEDFARWRNSSIIISILVIIGVLLFVRERMKPAVYVEPRQDAFFLSSINGDESLIPYDRLLKVSYAEELDTGEPAGGTDGKKARSGVWKNEMFGEYRLYALPKLTSCVILTTKEGITAFNYESEQTTKQIYDAFYDLMEKKGLADQIEFDPPVKKEERS